MKRNIFVIFLLVWALGTGVAYPVYRSKVTASYYADDFHGKKTSNGEVFNMWAMTCAHKMLPFDTKLKVTNLSNGKSVIVRVNDRGPFVASREIDLSKGAASKLGMIASGTAKVRLEIVSLGKYDKVSVVTGKKACAIAGVKYVQVKMPKTAKTKKSSEENSTSEVVEKIKNTVKEIGKIWDIQVGAFSERENALVFAKKVKKNGFDNVILQRANDVYRVVIKAVPSLKVNETVDLLFEKGYEDLVLRERKMP